MAYTDLKVTESPLIQGTGESVTYALTTTPWGSTPSAVTVAALDMTAGGTTVTSTVFPAGSVTTAGDVITAKPLTALTVGHLYRVVFAFTVSGQTYTPYLEVLAEGVPSLTNNYASIAGLKGRASIYDGIDDQTLADLIDTVSRLIDAFCGTRFYAATETRYYTARYSELLKIDDCLSISSLATDWTLDGTYSTTMASTEYYLGPYNAALLSPAEPYTWIEITPLGYQGFPARVRKGVKATGSWGFSATTPAAIREACYLQCARLFKRKDSPVGVLGFSPMGAVVRVPSELDPDVCNLIDRLPYNRNRRPMGWSN